MQEQEDDTRQYRAVVNHEEQYSIWFAERELPPGWKDAGKSGTKTECLDFIEEVWTDLRPLSLRKQMEEMAATPAEPLPAPEPGPSLVERLSEGEHSVVVSLKPENTAAAVKECLDEGYIHLKFDETRGGTHLVVPIDASSTRVDHADFEAPSGVVHVEGDLTLDFVPVRCVADIDLSNLRGRGFLRIRQPDSQVT